MDLSVIHDNTHAIALYEKLGFVRVPVFALKKQLRSTRSFSRRPPPEETLNPYARIIVDEARRRGISVEVLDAEASYFRLSHGGRSVVCRESLSELTTAIAMSRCDDKAVTRRLLAKAGLSVPRQQPAGDAGTNARFLEACGSVVVKPARGEQGRGISVDVDDAGQVEAAIEAARRVDDQVLLEEFVVGQDLRIIVIDFRVVAAAVRRPPQVRGTGQHTVRELIERQSRRRQAATGGESRIPVDAETARCLRARAWSSTRCRRPAGASKCAAPPTCTPAAPFTTSPTARPPLAGGGARGARWTSRWWGSTFMVPDPAGGDYGSSRPTSGRGWPTTSRSRPPSASSTCCSRSRCPLTFASTRGAIFETTEDRRGLPQEDPPRAARHPQSQRLHRRDRALLLSRARPARRALRDSPAAAPSAPCSRATGIVRPARSSPTSTRWAPR
jgi:hypothetical protein